MSYNVRPTAGSSTAPVSHGGTATPPDPTVIDAAKDTFIANDTADMKISATGRVVSRTWTSAGLTPLQEKAMKVVLTAAAFAMSQISEPTPSEGGKPTPPRRK